MSSKITFLNDHLIWPVISGAVILLVVFIWKELHISGRGRFILKTFFSLLAIGALALIALKPSLPTSETGGKIVLLTPGFEKTQLDSLREIHPRLKVINYELQQPIYAAVKAAGIVYILGNGIPEYDLSHFDGIPANYIPGTSPQGVINVLFPDKIDVGENFTVSGLYHEPQPGNRLVLQGPGGVGLDSVELGNGQEQRFKLSTELKAAGNLVYYLAEKDDRGEVLSQDPVPLSVEEKVKMRILILNNFPTFETKYLKNLLAEAGHELVVRSQITRGRFKYEYFNTNRTVIGSLSRETLEPYDLLIIDAPSMRSLAGSQTGVIQNSVREDGMGVFIQPDETFFSSPGPVSNLKFERQSNTEVKLEDWPDVKLSVSPFTFNLTTGQESLYSDGNKVITGYAKIGHGRIGSTVLNNTWEMILEGNIEAYRQIWSGIVGGLSKREYGSPQYKPQGQFAFPHEPLNFIIRTSKQDPVITNEGGSIIALKQDLNFPDQWKGTLWPGEQGWNNLQQDTSAVFDYYVSTKGSWDALSEQNTLENNMRYFSTTADDTKKGQFPPEPINPLWFFGIFLISMGALWLEPKLS